MQRIGRHLSYANVAATLALLFAMSGGALAANHYLISSTRQISPKVLKKLKGARGPAGAAGAAGLPGAAGSPGLKGAKGTNGERGEPGISALSTLPPGASESGTFGLGLVGGNSGETLETSGSFPVPLAAGIVEGHAITTAVNTPVAHCGGPGNADAGYLCIYINIERGLNPATKLVFNPEIKPPPGGSGRFGFMMAWTITAAEPAVFGTFTVTAE